MKAIVQRVKGETRIHSVLESEAIQEEHSFHGPGLVVLLGWEKADEEKWSELPQKESWIRSRIEGLRIFPDAEGRMNLNLSSYLESSPQKEGGILWVPQFTLAAHLKSGFRPSFTRAMAPQMAKERFHIWQKSVLEDSYSYKNLFGVFSAEMDLSFTNWGPVTIPLE